MSITCISMFPLITERIMLSPSSLSADASARWHEKAVKGGPTFGINNFETGTLIHPTGYDKLAGGWENSGYALKLEVSQQRVPRGINSGG